MEPLKVSKWYEEAKDYMKQQGYFNKWSECDRFKSGNQWPAPTEKTKNLPRPVINVIRYIENHKVSQILNEPVKMVFSPDELNEEDKVSIVGANVFSQYSATEWENVKQDALNEKALDKASNIGTAIWHYFMDNEKTGGRKLKWIGNLAGETLDSINCFVGNPQQQDTQKQPYILITGRYTVEEARAEAKRNGVKEAELLKIVGDSNTQDEGYDTAQKELKEKVTVVTAYWKENGTVWMAKACNDVWIKKPIDTLHRLYPIVAMQWYEKDKSWYGVGDTEGLINNQKSINLMVAMQMMSAQSVGMPKLMLKQGFISSYNNDPYTPIMDNNPDGWSAQYLQPTAMTSQVSELVDFLLTNSKTLSGATETATGELAKSSQMNATAIMLLQKASGVPIESIKRRFRRAMEEIGQIWLEFWTINYNTARLITLKDDLGNDIAAEFRGADFKDVGLKLKIDIGASSDYSEPLIMSVLDKFHDAGKLDDAKYVEMAPASVIPNKQELIKYFENKENDKVNKILSMLPPDLAQMIMMQIEEPQQPMPQKQPNMPQPTPQI